MELKAVSLFCGCGGADLGLVGGFDYLGKIYPKNNIEIVHASDINPKAIETYNANFSHKALCEDVCDIDFKLNEADIVIGGFPCQNFSTVNPTKDPEDKSNQLFWELSRVVKQTQPKVFIGENVRGFATLKKGKYLRMALEEFENIGYDVQWTILNSSHYGVPQLRQRVFIVGFRKDLNLKGKFQFPEATHGPGLKPITPLKRVLFDHDTVGEKYYFSARAVEGVKKAKKNMKRAVAQDTDGPCLTITAHLAKVSLNSRDPVLLVNPEKERYRRFSPREAARIQSFPDSFEFPVSQGNAYIQIGNAIPPVIMWHLVRSVTRTLNNQSNENEPIIDIESRQYLLAM
jgi:DNA (cytosine-5)-methyltransferase 1